MGVHGLWKLIDKAGRPIPVESLENKVLAIDVSIWLYQLVRGFDSSARPGSNMFLLGLFHRICKLLFYRIKPIFVFDGGVPSLKKKTIAARQKGRRKAQESIEKVRQQLLENLIKQQALGDVLGENVKIPKQFTSKQDELFWLPPISEGETISRLEEEESDSEDDQATRKYAGDLNSVDVNSEDFLKLPADVRHDILTDLKETRKLNSWAKIHLMPEEADDFSSFQMGRLLKRRAVQVGLDKAAEELGVRGFTVNDLENILTEQGIDLSQRIAGDSATRFVYSSYPVEKSNDQSEISEDEDDPSHLPNSNSSDSEDGISPAVQKMAARENGDLSQQEILELIKQQQHRKVSRQAEFDTARAGTSKDFNFPEEEGSESLAEMGAHDRVNDPTVARGKDSDGDNEESKLEPGNLPGTAVPSGHTTTSQKDTPLWSNQVDGVSPCKNIPGSSNEAFEEQKNILIPHEEVESSRDITLDSTIENDTFMEVSSDGPNSPSISNKSLNIVTKPEESIEDDIFADVFSVKSVVEDAVAKSITLLTEKKTESTPQNKANIEKNGSGESKDDCLPKNALEIHIDPKNSVGDDDIFADVFPSPQSAKLSQSDPSKVQNLPKSLEIVIDPNASPEEDIFAEVFANPQPAKPTTSTVSPESQIVTPALPEPLEIVIDPNESPDEDIFADVFSQPADSVTTPTGSRSNVKEIDASQNTMNDSDDCGKSAESVEITVDPDAAPDDDLFADVSIETTHTNLPTIKPSFRKLVNDIKKSSSTRDLSDIKNILEKESQQLAGETKREERLASTITEQITQEAQNLLELFGIPYLIAPMEAEAQCAYLDLTGQTEGTITDDSDIWLFGANNVYKNFFDQKKFVRLFKSSDIHQCYRLNRDDMIMIAMLVGSDYTSGLAGVGPVNAIEIVAHFPRSQGAATPQSRLLKFVDAYLSSEMNPQLFKKLKSVEFTDGFPSDEVVKAYLSPIVDESKEKFSWSKPDLGKIKNFMRDKFGWDFNRTDKTLIPIFDKLNQSNTQKTIHNYFDWAFDLNEAATVSKRVGNAVEILTTGIIPSPSKKLRNDDATSNRSEPKDRMVSNYSRRKYGRYQQQEKELEKEPVLEGMRAARAAAKAIMTATRKPAAKSADVGGESSCSELPIGPSTSRGRGRPKKDVQDAKESSSSDRTTPKKRKPPADPDPVPSSSSCAPLPALSDILCGVGSEPSLPEVPSLWTPSRDLVSPYTKRKYGKVGQSTAPKRDPSNFAVPERPKQSFDHVMRSKTPAQIARERAAKKLKEAKQKAAQNKTKK